ncbi:acyl-CoA thioesterase [Parerythrobacter jejuensis]|uniref:Thioesterase family protein n=1 Tax=Parerythrobacter jejuensis TaxID=795812 RepID=A0A845AVL5_9SPHN|nr:thioesterase family protein [Parerythrobacter jejuensis]MXP30405.1 thioesterase family protein [Parerythrobacter jejuensis]MXP33165.1 thioesterase family protein [Parerythrobacter jejuensis]
MSVADLLAPITARSGAVTLPADDWLQGRTLYGGASALVAYTAAIRAFPELPPLRSAQVGFVAPVGAQVETRVEMVRQGRNVAQVRSELLVDGGVALTAFFLFGTEREPNALHPAPKVEPWPGAPEENDLAMSDKGPNFIRSNFEIRRAQDMQGAGDPVVRRWIRLKDEAGLDPTSRLVLLGDTLPPGAMRAMQRQGPISSINWSFNVLTPRAETDDGWWLAETASDHADHGYSSERLRLWNSQGELVMVGQQAVAVFG